jgi:hypothetical protein
MTTEALSHEQITNPGRYILNILAKATIGSNPVELPEESGCYASEFGRSGFRLQTPLEAPYNNLWVKTEFAAEQDIEQLQSGDYILKKRFLEEDFILPLDYDDRNGHVLLPYVPGVELQGFEIDDAGYKSLSIDAIKKMHTLAEQGIELTDAGILLGSNIWMSGEGVDAEMHFIDIADITFHQESTSIDIMMNHFITEMNYLVTQFPAEDSDSKDWWNNKAAVFVAMIEEIIPDISDQQRFVSDYVITKLQPSLYHLSWEHPEDDIGFAVTNTLENGITLESMRAFCQRLRQRSEENEAELLSGLGG